MVKKMKNKEKFLDKIIDLVCTGERIAVNNKGEVVSCISVGLCRNCKFGMEKECEPAIRKWLEEEYVEPTVINIRDRAFLDYLRENDKYIARDKNDNLFVYETKPRKAGMSWSMNGSLVCNSCLYLNRHFNVDFPMVKWEDEEPWKIDDLRKLEVCEDYE